MIQLVTFVLYLILTVSKVAETAPVTKPLVVIDKSPLPGTTENIEQIFKDRCLNFFKKGYANTESLPAEIANTKDPVVFCSQVWKEFYKAWGGKNICTVKEEDYNGYFKITGAHKKILNKALFWSGLMKLAGLYADHGKRAYTVADTLTGFLVSDLNWCGDPRPGRRTGINFKKCERCRTRSDDVVTKEGFEVFWARSSELFAKQAVGEARVLLTGTGKTAQGTPRTAFSKKSFFYKNELPNLDANQVTKLKVFLINNPKLTPLQGEHCGSGSLRMLKDEVEKKGIKDGKEIPFECIENPPYILRYLAK